MRKNRFIIVATLLLAIPLSGCGILNQTGPEQSAEPGQTTGPEQSTGPDSPPSRDPANTEAEYRRITPEEALSMMSDETIILDVRTQEEFDNGHIRNAILLPYDEVREKAAGTLTDKDRIILIYCRSGRRSEVASRELIDMGYTAVFDFGGIIDWPGEIVYD